MAIFEVVLRQTVVGQAAINRWNYISSGGVGAALPSFALAEAFGIELTAGEFPADTVLRGLQFLQTTDVKFNSLQVRNVYDPTDFWEAIFPAGTEGEATPRVSAPFLAYGWVSNQTRLDISKGHKRVTGVTEDNIDPGGGITSGCLTVMNGIGGSMSEILTYAEDGASLAFAPSIMGKEKYLSHTSPDRYSYRYYATEAAQLAHAASPVVWSAMDVVRSQVSRQYNHGS